MSPHLSPLLRNLRSLAAIGLLVPMAALADAVAGTPTAAEGCADCHGKAGVSTETDVPTIAGHSAVYLKETMGAYRDGERPCPESKYRAGDTTRAPTDMCKITKALSEQEIAELAEHFAGLPFVRAKQNFDPAKAAVGKKVHQLHCEKCHADGGSSPDDDSGILAGQWMPYLQTSMKEFTDGTRKAPKKMKPKVDELSADQIDALVHYYGSQQ